MTLRCLCDEASLIDLLDLMAVWSIEMKRTEREPMDSVIDDLKAKQRNLTWPDVLRGNRSVDEFLWKGARDAPMVQRIGAIILAVAYLAVALFFIDWTSNGGGWLSGLLSLVLIAAGAKIVHSATRH